MQGGGRHRYGGSSASPDPQDASTELDALGAGRQLGEEHRAVVGPALREKKGVVAEPVRRGGNMEDCLPPCLHRHDGYSKGLSVPVHLSSSCAHSACVDARRDGATMVCAVGDPKACATSLWRAVMGVECGSSRHVAGTRTATTSAWTHSTSSAESEHARVVRLPLVSTTRARTTTRRSIGVGLR